MAKWIVRGGGYFFQKPNGQYLGVGEIIDDTELDIKGQTIKLEEYSDVAYERITGKPVEIKAIPEPVEKKEEPKPEVKKDAEPKPVTTSSESNANEDEDKGTEKKEENKKTESTGRVV